MSSVRESPAIPISEFDHLREGRRIIRQEAEALLAVSNRLNAGFCRAVEMILNARSETVVTGIGKAGLIGKKIVATMLSTGTRARFLHPVEAVHGDLGCLTEGNVVLTLSNSGETEELLQLLPHVERVRAPIVAVTASPHSTLGQAAQVVLELGRLREAGVSGLAPSTSTTAMLALGDALALVLSRSRGFSARDFALCHPGGSLGQRLKPIRDVMRQDEALRIAHENSTVREVFAGLSQPGRRTGAVMLVDSGGRLVGLFTDSDLARMLEQRQDGQLDGPIGAVMTRNPVTIGVDASLEDAVALLSERKVSELPAIDADGRPVGLIDITDVIGLIPREPSE